MARWSGGASASLTVACCAVSFLVRVRFFKNARRVPRLAVYFRLVVGNFRTAGLVPYCLSRWFPFFCFRTSERWDCSSEKGRIRVSHRGSSNGTDSEYASGLRTDGGGDRVCSLRRPASETDLQRPSLTSPDIQSGCPPGRRRAGPRAAARPPLPVAPASPCRCPT